MIQSYLFPVSYAFLAFPFAALLFTLPFLIVQYRRHGYIHKARAWLLYLMLLYLMNAFFLVILPLPSSRHNAALAGGALQFIPLQFIHDIVRETSVSPAHPSSYLHVLKERAFLQVAFNVLMTVPFGIFLRYYFRARWGWCLILSFTLSLFFEVTQLTGLYGFFDHAYRVFDVDDLMANTLGGMLGFLLGEWFSRFLPRLEHLDKHLDITTKRVSYTRRGVAFFLDSIVWTGLLGIMESLHVPAAFWVSSGVYFMLVPCLTNGRTPGKWLVRIHLTGTEKRVSLWGLIKRYSLLYWLYFGLNYVLGGPVLWSRVSPWVSVLISLLLLVMNGWFFFHLVIRLFKKGPLFYEELSHTSHQISWPKRHDRSQGDTVDAVEPPGAHTDV
ncbi:VanZ family protein [Paenibacillus kribbensis]|uniref:VanZ family protein n=1 Tax=Paenibacillus kribbensis TaxID=172713 RepID=UPI002DBB8E1D|nr:VanZ family protein [Paenibacillus kribbensis]MEC0234958.1 VanZ family protein [Paenibacillus kribbensis]